MSRPGDADSGTHGDVDQSAHGHTVGDTNADRYPTDGHTNGDAIGDRLPAADATGAGAWLHGDD